jgi:hypothetical protein
LGLVDIMVNDNVVLPTRELKESYLYLRRSAVELDAIITELNAFIEQTGKQSNINYTVKPKVAPLTALQLKEYAKNKALIPAVK